MNLGSDLMEPFRPFIDYWVAGHKRLGNLTPDIKYGLVEVQSLIIKYNGRKMHLSEAVNEHVHKCLDFLNGKTEEVRIEMSLVDEVPNNAIDDNI
ncbi:hypothetical protein LCB40_16570 [Lactobacillus corticis]|uniref:Uncharacterized protein n=1 Tax=Lactobacillus corticis TaxID=2201249 RepID=A0A916QKN3_9LACO|nr:hypothetical protein LCB40_16570 [Lactobacillus corticis]